MLVIGKAAKGTGEIDATGAEQDEVVVFLCDPASWSLQPDCIEHIETHGAHVFLAGDHALKIKRSVRYSYMDFSTLEKRRLACERETEINRRFAPRIYLGAVPIVRKPSGALAVGGPGVIVEWAVSMRRFDQDALLSQLARRDGLTPQIIKSLAAVVLASHRVAEPNKLGSGVSRLRSSVADISHTLIGCDEANIRQLATEFRSRANLALNRCADQLDRRQTLGFVRRCHGDLHLNNIVLIDGKPTLFDAIEFDEQMATIDTLYDLAFLLMDLDAANRRSEANLLLGHYLWLSGSTADLEGLRALPLFLALRAAIRAMVGLQRSAVAGHGPTDHVTRSPLDYLTRAVCYLETRQPRLIAIGGLSGSGKSALAAALAPRFGAAPGALDLRSDQERKSLFCAGETERLPSNAYTSDVSAAVYSRLLERARVALDAGHSVIVDAVFSDPGERDALEAIARDRGIAFNGLWLTATPETVTRRIRARQNDASDATPEVALAQLAKGPGPLSWFVVEADDSPAAVLGRATALLQLDPPRTREPGI